MVGNCVAFKCFNKSTKNSGISFYRFPKDPDICKKWVAAIKRENFVPTRHSRLCSVHFTKDSFYIRPHANTDLLKNSAVPTLFDFPPGLAPPHGKRRINTYEKTPVSPNVRTTPSNIEVITAHPVNIEVTPTIIKEEIDVPLDNDYVYSSETSIDGHQMEFEDSLQSDPLGDTTQHKSYTTSDNEANYQTRKEPETSGTHNVSGLKEVLKIADTLSLDIKNILTDDICSFGDINPTRSTAPIKPFKPTASIEPSSSYLNVKHSALEEKLRIHYLKTMIRKEEELIDLKIKLNRLKVMREEIELGNSKEIHILSVENLQLQNARLKSQLQRKCNCKCSC